MFIRGFESDLRSTQRITLSVTCCCCVAAAVAAAAVSRYICRSELYEFDLAIDINIDIYPLKVGRALAAQQLQPHLAAQQATAIAFKQAAAACLPLLHLLAHDQPSALMSVYCVRYAINRCTCLRRRWVTSSTWCWPPPSTGMARRRPASMTRCASSSSNSSSGMPAAAVACQQHQWHASSSSTQDN